MADGAPVVIVEKGGVPVTPVASGAPVVTVAENGRGTPITLTEKATPVILTGATPPPVPGPLEVVIRDNSGFTNFSQSFDLATDSAILGLACAIVGDPVISIAHGGEPLTIVNQTITNDTRGRKWMALLAVGTGLTVGTDVLTITATGGELQGGALRINEMASIDNPSVGWEDAVNGGGQPIAPIEVGATSGGIIKGVFVNSTADRQHGDRITGATDVFNGYTTTGEPVAVDMTTAGAWVLDAGWTIDGDDFVHAGAASAMTITFPQTDYFPSFRCLADIAQGASVVINGGRLETYTSKGLWPIATYDEPRLTSITVRATGNVRISRCDLIQNCVPVAWIFFSTTAVTGQEITPNTVYVTTQWGWVASEVMGEDY